MSGETSDFFGFLWKSIQAHANCTSPYHATVQTHYEHIPATKKSTMASPATKSFFRITLVRSAIGLPRKTSGVLRALGLRKRLRTVYHPVTPDVAGQIFAVKELVDVQEVDRALTTPEMKELRRPERGFWVERRAAEQRAVEEAKTEA